MVTFANCKTLHRLIGGLVIRDPIAGVVRFFSGTHRQNQFVYHRKASAVQRSTIGEDT
jgi:hypothetical protein